MAASTKSGISNLLVEALLIIVGVTVAVSFSSVVMSRLSEFQSRFTVVSSEAIQGFSEKLIYVHATYDPNLKCFLIYLKNVGSYPIQSLSRASIIFKGGNSFAMYIQYSDSPSAGCGCWDFVEYGVGNGVIDPAETVAIRIYNSTAIQPPYYLKFITSRGTSVECEFTLL
ncbi:MAG: hypothetical protein N3G48_07455 [Sulfolobales archaeon]|nr:hypothetical protein [Sulfolobales archaeon]MCX8186922.1 hypothetical protein [Sulfolobales archaeon]